MTPSAKDGDGATTPSLSSAGLRSHRMRHEIPGERGLFIRHVVLREESRRMGASLGNVRRGRRDALESQRSHRDGSLRRPGGIHRR